MSKVPKVSKPPKGAKSRQSVHVRPSQNRSLTNTADAPASSSSMPLQSVSHIAGSSLSSSSGSTLPSASYGPPGTSGTIAEVSDTKDQSLNARPVRASPQSNIVVPSSARSKRIQRQRPSPPSVQHVRPSSSGASAPTRHVDTQQAVENVEAPCSSASSSRTPPQTSAKLTRPRQAAVPRYLEPTVSHSMYTASIKEETADRTNGDADSEALASGSAGGAARTSPPPHRKTPPPSLRRASPLVVVPPTSTATAAATGTTTTTASTTATRVGDVSPVLGSRPPLLGSSSAVTGAPPTPVLRRGVVGPSTGGRRSSLPSNSSSADSRRPSVTSPPPLVQDTENSLVIVTSPLIVSEERTDGTPSDAQSKLPEWRQPPPKSILKITNTKPLSPAMLREAMASSTGGRSASRSSASEPRQRCVKFDEENLRITGTTDTRAFEEEEAAAEQAGSGSTVGKPLHLPRHLRSPQARRMGPFRPGNGVGGGGSWGRDSAWFDNQFGLDPTQRHSPPPPIVPVLASPTCGPKTNTPVRTTFKSNPFTRAAKMAEAEPIPDTPPPDNDAVFETTDVASELTLSSTPEVFSLQQQQQQQQQRKPLLSAHQNVHHQMDSFTAVTTTAAVPPGLGEPQFSGSPLSPTERKLLDALAKSALASQVRREVYIAADADSRNALESSGALPITPAQQASLSDYSTASRSTKTAAPSSESRGLQRFLRGSPNSEEPDRGSSQSLASPTTAPHTEVTPSTTDTSNSVTHNSTTTTTTTTSSDEKASTLPVYSSNITRLSYQLPSSLSKSAALSTTEPLTSPPPSSARGASGALVLKVNSSPSSLSSSFSTSGRPPIVSSRPPRSSVSPSMSSQEEGSHDRLAS